MSDSAIQHTEGVTLAALLSALIFLVLVTRFRRTRPQLLIALPLAVGLALRLAAIAGISSTGLEATLRGGDETTFLELARHLAAQPLGHGFLPHGPYQLQTVLFALQLKLGFLSLGALRVTQVTFAELGVLLIIVSVHDLASPRAARTAAWLLAFEPTSMFFNSEIHKDPLMELAAGLVVFGGTWMWRRLDLRGILVCAFGGLIGVETRAYAGWFLVSAAVIVILHISLRSMGRRTLRAMPLVYVIVIGGFVVTPTLLAATSGKNLKNLQASQAANASGAGEGSGHANSTNLALEKVNFSSRGAIISHLPVRMRELVLQPYPWQLSDASQRFGAIGTLVAYAIVLLLLRYAWLSRGQVFRRAGPILYPLMFLTVAYSLAVGNAGTGFRYRSHLVTLALASLVILREHVQVAREGSRAAAADPQPASGRLVHRPPGFSPA